VRRNGEQLQERQGREQCRLVDGRGGEGARRHGAAGRAACRLPFLSGAGARHHHGPRRDREHDAHAEDPGRHVRELPAHRGDEPDEPRRQGVPLLRTRHRPRPVRVDAAGGAWLPCRFTSLQVTDPRAPKKGPSPMKHRVDTPVRRAQPHAWLAVAMTLGLAITPALARSEGQWWGQEERNEHPENAKFSKPSEITNAWFPMKPGLRMTFEGTSVTDEGVTVKRRMQVNVT